ncbi:MAG: hypothetical protein RLZZ325_1185, partial [Pseudomonadota bacterium]
MISLLLMVGLGSGLTSKLSE